MNTTSPINYFDLLGVSKSSSKTEVRDAYLAARTSYLNQMNSLESPFDANDIKEILNILEEAYVILTHPSLKELYIKKINSGYTKPVSLDDLKNEHLDVKEVTTKSSSLFKQPVEFEEFDGPTIKALRDRLNISIEELSQITKVSVDHLLSIETHCFEKLPAPVYVRGYIFQIARTLGIDHVKATKSYMKIYGEQKDKSLWS